MNINSITDKKKQIELFCVACGFSSDVNIVKLLCEKYSIIINDATINEENCFFFACYINDCIDVIKFLAENTNIKMQDKNGNTSLHIASENNSPLILEYLIKEKDLDPWALNGEGFDCLMRSSYLNQNLYTIKYYIEVIGMSPFCTNKIKQNCLILACQRNNVEIIKYLIEVKKMDPLFKDGKGYNCINWACHINHIDVIKYLMTVINYMNKSTNEVNYLIDACRNNMDVNVIKYLIEDNKMDTNYYNIDGNNCLLFN